MAKKREAAVPKVLTGLAFEVTGNELMSRVTQRISWHERHVKQADAQLRRLLGDDDARVDVRADSIRRELGKQVREHEQRVSFLSFARDHLVRQALYRLSPSDLKMLDIMPDGYTHY